MAKRFLTADSFFMERPDKIVGSPWEGGLYGYAGNDPVNNSDPSGDVVETAFDVASVAIGVQSFIENATQGNVLDAAIDAVGIALDTAAALTPFVPGGVGLGIKAVRGADKVVEGLKVADKAVEGLRSGKSRLAHIGPKKSVIPGSVVKGTGKRRAFVTDKAGKIQKEIRPGSVKIRKTNPLPGGGSRDTFIKDNPGRDLTSGESKILDSVQGTK